MTEQIHPAGTFAGVYSPVLSRVCTPQAKDGKVCRELTTDEKSQESATFTAACVPLTKCTSLGYSSVEQMVQDLRYLVTPAASVSYLLGRA